MQRKTVIFAFSSILGLLLPCWSLRRMERHHDRLAARCFFYRALPPPSTRPQLRLRGGVDIFASPYGIHAQINRADEVELQQAEAFVRNREYWGNSSSVLASSRRAQFVSVLEHLEEREDIISQCESLNVCSARQLELFSTAPENMQVSWDTSCLRLNRSSQPL